MISQGGSSPQNAGSHDNFLLSTIKVLKQRLDVLESRVSEQESCVFDLRAANNSLRADLLSGQSKTMEDPNTVHIPTPISMPIHIVPNSDNNSSKRKIDEVALSEKVDHNILEPSEKKQRKKSKKRRRALAAVSIAFNCCGLALIVFLIIYYNL